MTLQIRPVNDASECLLRIVEAAPQVRRRYQFFMWTQGDLQRWLPHKLLVCGAYDRQARQLVFDVFNSVPLPEPALSGLHDGHDALMVLALRVWRQSRLQAAVLHLGDVGGPARGCAAALMEAGYRQLVVHGLSRPGRPEEVETFFMLGLPGEAAGDATLQALDMLLPCLHLTYARVYATESQMGGGRSTGAGSPGTALAATMAGTPNITEREREILRWVRDGMSNLQISEKLHISPLTVKNHIQKILRKMGAANRAQAVAKAMTHNLLQAGSQPGAGEGVGRDED